MTLAELLQQFGGSMGGGNPYGGAAGALGGGIGAMQAGRGYGPGGRVQVVGQGPQAIGPYGQHTPESFYNKMTQGRGPSWTDLLRKAAGAAPLPQPAYQPQPLAPIERHPFEVGNWGGMHATLAARGNVPMGGGYDAPRGLSPMAGAFGGSLASLLGRGGF